MQLKDIVFVIIAIILALMVLNIAWTITAIIFKLVILLIVASVIYLSLKKL